MTQRVAKIALNLPSEIPSETAKKVLAMYDFYAENHEVKPQDLVNFTDLAHILVIIDQCYADIRKNGVLTTDRYDQPKKNPSLDILKDFQNQKTTIMREYGLTEKSKAQITKMRKSEVVKEEETEFEKSLHEFL